MFRVEMNNLKVSKYHSKLPYSRFDNKYLVPYHCAMHNCQLECNGAKQNPYQTEFERLRLDSEQFQTLKPLRNVATTTVIYHV